MAKLYGSYERILQYFQEEPKARAAVSRLPQAIQRKMITDFAQTQAGGITRNKLAVEGTILSEEFLETNKEGKVTPIHERVLFMKDGAGENYIDSPSPENHRFIINDIEFEILPTQINIQYQTHTFKSNHIRSQGPSKTKSGRGIISIQVQLFFVGLREINSKLRRLVAQTRIFPICYIQNEFIDRVVNPENILKNVAVAVNNLSITTYSEATDTLVATLSMEVFNWEIYSRHFHYSTYFIPPDSGNMGISQNKAVSSPSFSPLFTAYWDSVLNSNSIEIPLIEPSTLQSVEGQKKEKDKIQIYKTPDSFSFSEITDADWKKEGINIQYEMYKTVPKEVLDRIATLQHTPIEEDPRDGEPVEAMMNSTIIMPTNAQVDKFTQVRKSRLIGLDTLKSMGNLSPLMISTEEGGAAAAKAAAAAITKSPSLTFQPYAKSPWAQESALLDGNKIPYQLFLGYARKIGDGKTYLVGVPRNSLQNFDCSSLVYNTLRAFGIYVGSSVSTFKTHLSRIYRAPLFSGPLDATNRSVSGMGGTGLNLIDVPFNLEGHLLLNYSAVSAEMKKTEQYKRARASNKIWKGPGHTGLGTDEYWTEHISIIYRDTGQVGKSNRLKIYHAYGKTGNKVALTGLGTVRGIKNRICYHEVYPIPGAMYPKDEAQRKHFEKILASTDFVSKAGNAFHEETKKLSQFTEQQLKANRVVIEKNFNDISLQLYKQSKQYASDLVKALSFYLKKNRNWELTWLRNGTILLKTPASFDIDTGENFTNGPVLTNISLSIANTFSRIPMVAHELVAHQYLGGGDCTVWLQFKCIGLEFVHQLNAIRKYTESAARVYRLLDNVGMLTVNHPILSMIGSKQFLIESIEESTDKESPNCYNVTVQLTEQRLNQRKDEGFVQEFGTSKKLENSFVEELIKKPTPEFEKFELDTKLERSTTNDEIWEIKKGIRNDIALIMDNTASLYRDEISYISRLVDYTDAFTAGGFSTKLHIHKEALKRPQSLLNQQRNLFREKKTLFQFMFKVLFMQLLYLTKEELIIMGITRSDLNKWSKMENHPLYSYNAFNQFKIKRQFIGSTISHYRIDDELGFWDLPEDIEFYKKNYPSIKRDIENIFEETTKNRVNPFGTLGQSGIFRTAYDLYEGALGLFRGMTNMVFSAGASWLDIAKKTLSDDVVFALVELKGSKSKEADKVFATFGSKTSTTREEGDPAKRYVTNANTEIRSAIIEERKGLNIYKNDLHELRLKAGLNLLVTFGFFRAMVSQLSKIAMDQMKYSEGVGNYMSKGSPEEMSFFGLPAYQDIPTPYIDFSNTKYGNAKDELAKLGRPSLYYLNPDFYFYNESDDRETDGNAAAFLSERASRLMLANLHLAQSFGIGPMSKDNKLNIGHLAALGSVGTLGSEIESSMRSAETDKTKQAAKPNSKINQPLALAQDHMNRLPDLMGLYTQNNIARRFENGRVANGLPMGISPGSQIVSNNRVLLPDEINDKTKRNPLVPYLESVNFGPTAFETRLGVYMDRTPGANMQSMITAFKSRNFSPFRMRRALPAFKLYFIEDDTSGFGGTDPSSYIRSYDDFFSYKAIKEVQFVSSRKMPASHLIIRLSNLYGNLDTLEFSNSVISKESINKAADSERASMESIKLEAQDTPSENPFTRFILKEGIRVQFKAGNENNPSEMPIVFNGQIVQINQESGDEIVIVCQDFATQLVADLKGPDKNSIPTAWVDTFELLSYLICQPEMTMFGRWTLDSQVSVGESRSRGGWEKVFKMLADPKDDNIFAPNREATVSILSDNNGSFMTQIFRTAHDITTTLSNNRNYSVNIGDLKVGVQYLGIQGSRKAFVINVPGTVILGGQGKVGSAVTGGAVGTQGILSFSQKLEAGASKILNYHIYRTTVWDVYKEMELRHPGWIAHPVNYASRMTMFFGQPSQLYWYRPMNPFEKQQNIIQNKELNSKLNVDENYNKVKAELAKVKYTTGDRVTTTVKENIYSILDWASFIATVGLTVATIKAGGAGGLVGGATRSALMPLARKFLVGGAIGYAVTSTMTSDNSSWTRILGGIGGGVVALGSPFAGIAALGKVLFGGGLARKIITGAAITAYLGGQGFRAYDSYAQQSRVGRLLALGSIENKIKEDMQKSVLKEMITNRVRPYRNYHLIDSKHHIVSNQIKSSVHGIYNAVTLEYTSDPEDTSEAVMVDGATKKTKILKASHRILDKDLRMGFFSYPNCRGLYMADRYAQGLLMRHFKDSYKGQLIILGDWSMKPYDRIVLEDNYTGMYGQFEVEQVVTTLSPELGCITEITPDMIVYGNNIVDMPYDNFMSAYLSWKKFGWDEVIKMYLSNDPKKFLEGMKRKDNATTYQQGIADYTEGDARLINSIPGALVASVLGVGAAVGLGAKKGLATVGLGALGGGTTGLAATGGSIGNALSYIQYKLFGSLSVKFYEWSTARQPLIFEPLWMNGKPMLPSIDMDKVSMLQNIQDNFHVVSGNINKGFDVLADGGKTLVYGDISQLMSGLQ